MALLAPIKYNSKVQPFELTAGDDLPVEFRLKIGTSYVVFTNWDFAVTVRDTNDLAQIKAELTVGNGITISDYVYTDENDVVQTVTDGRVEIIIPSTATEALRSGTKSLSFDLQTVSDTGQKRTFIPSVITGPKDITRT